MTELYILTGPSGSGKTSAQYVFEEKGYFVIENILPSGVKSILEDLYIKNKTYTKCVFISMPIYALDIYQIAQDTLSNVDCKIKTIVLDCDDDTLYKRFKLTRHVHPLTILNNITLSEAIRLDRKFINQLIEHCDYYFDTSNFQLVQLRKTLLNIIDNRLEDDIVMINFISFGHKFGIPLDVDLVLDTRALPNPYWDENLRKYNGLDQQIADYLKKYQVVDETINNMINYLDFYLKLVQKDGRGNYTIGICCSGGKHRSVYIANILAKHYRNKYNVMCFHRDMDKE